MKRLVFCSPQHQRSLRSVFTAWFFASLITVSIGTALLIVPVSAQYKMPPKPVADVIDALPTPSVLPSPRGDALLLIEIKPNPSIAVLAEPILRLGGVRFSPALNASQRTQEIQGYVVQRIGTGASSLRIQIPEGSRVGIPVWSFDGSKIAFTRDVADGVELWIADAATGKAQPIKGVRVCDIIATPFKWMSDNKHLLVNTVPAHRGKAPELQRIPSGPVIEESYGKQTQVRTYQDLLQNTNDEALFAYYTTTQLAIVDAAKGTVKPLGSAAMITGYDFSPDEKYLLVTRLQKPFSYRVPYDDFPKSIELWDAQGSMVKQLASLPLADQTPREGVPLGMRNPVWQPLHSAKLLWAEALDGGDPMNKADFRDKIMALAAPFTSEPQEVCKVKHRFAGYGWTAQKDKVLMAEYDRERRWRTTYLADISTQPVKQTVLFDLSINDSMRAISIFLS